MIINRENILQAILEHKSFFYKFVDMINDGDAGLQFPMSAYLDFYDRNIPHDNDKLKRILSMKTLEDANVFIRVDGMSGLITLSREVYNILVWLDISRKKQLDSQLFEAHRLDILRLAKDLSLLPMEGQDFRETYAFFHEKMTDIQSDISENVRVLEDRVDQIADMYKNREAGIVDISLDDIYDKAHHIYNRNILPCLEFIKPSLELKATTNLAQTLSELEGFFESVGEVDKARNLQFRVRAIFSYYKDIGTIADRLNSYLTSLAQDRRFFLSMEKAFGVLMDSLEPLRSGGHKKLLDASSEVFALSDTLDGIMQPMTGFEGRLNYSPNYATDRFESYFELIQKKPLKKNNAQKTRPAPLGVDIDDERNVQILDIILMDVQTPAFIANVHAFIWEQLQVYLPAPTIIDFFYALEHFLGGVSDQCVTQRRAGRDRISDDNYHFDFLIWDYNEENENG